MFTPSAQKGVPVPRRNDFRSPAEIRPTLKALGNESKLLNVNAPQAAFIPSVQKEAPPIVKMDLQCKAKDGTFLKATPRLNFDAFQSALAEYPNKPFVKKILDTIKYGANVGIPMEGRTKGTPCDCINHPSSFEERVKVHESIQTDLAVGTKLGPFSSPPLNGFVCSPIAAIPKKGSDKVRIIHNLSHPKGFSVNDLIDDQDASVQYQKFDILVDMVRKTGTGAWMAKVDLQSAYTHVLVNPKFWRFLGFHLDTPSGREYYIETSLPFGLRSSCRLFSEFSGIVSWIAHRRGIQQLFYLLDDFVIVADSQESCQRQLKILLELFAELGFQVNPKKVEGPSQVLTALGIEVDCTSQQLRIDQSRLADILSLLQEWEGKSSASRRDLASLLGKLHFVSTVCYPGRSFLRRLIECLKSEGGWNSKVTIPLDAKADILWWRLFLPSWNGVSTIPEWCWTLDADISLSTDACTRGAGAFFQGRWLYFPFEETSWFYKQSIPFKELFAVSLALATWGPLWKGKKIRFRIDSKTATVVLNSRKARSPAMAAVLRQIFYLSAINDCLVSGEWVAGLDNPLADSASRGDTERLFRLAPLTCRTPDAIPPWFIMDFFDECTSVQRVPTSRFTDGKFSFASVQDILLSRQGTIKRKPLLPDPQQCVQETARVGGARPPRKRGYVSGGVYYLGEESMRIAETSSSTSSEVNAPAQEDSLGLSQQKDDASIHQQENLHGSDILQDFPWVFGRHQSTDDNKSAECASDACGEKESAVDLGCVPNCSEIEVVRKIDEECVPQSAASSSNTPPRRGGRIDYRKMTQSVVEKNLPLPSHAQLTSASSECPPTQGQAVKSGRPPTLGDAARSRASFG